MLQFMRSQSAGHDLATKQEEAAHHGVMQTSDANPAHAALDAEVRRRATQGC